MKNVLKQGGVFTAFIFNFSSEYGVMKTRTNQKELKLKRVHQLPVYAANDNVLGKHIHIVKKKTRNLDQSLITKESLWKRSRVQIFRETP